VGVHTADWRPHPSRPPEIRVVAAVHAGWRGLAAGIVEERSAPSRGVRDTAVEGIVAVAGPCARGCCYEVGGIRRRRSRSPGGTFAPEEGKTSGKWTADLQAIALAALRVAGSPPDKRRRWGPARSALPVSTRSAAKNRRPPGSEFSLHQGLTGVAFLRYLVASGSDQRTFGDNPLPFGVPSERFSTMVKTVVFHLPQENTHVPGESA